MLYRISSERLAFGKCIATVDCLGHKLLLISYYFYPQVPKRTSDSCNGLLEIFQSKAQAACKSDKSAHKGSFQNVLSTCQYVVMGWLLCIALRILLEIAE